MLEIRSARKVFYKGQADEKVALDGLNLSLATGEFGVVIGSNGAGKSSMLNAISGHWCSIAARSSSIATM